MEGKQDIQTFIVLGTAIILLFAIVFLVLIIDKRRKLNTKQSIINLLENDCKKAIESLRSEMEEEIDELKKVVLKDNKDRPL